ncbi:DUF1749 domain-containing protein [bacterium]|nr:DUF1749 domain-containing protein [bacterium]
MDILKIETPRGLELKGAIFDAQNKELCAILVTGICSNLFQNELLYETGKLLQKNNITTVIAHLHDAFSCFAYSDLKENKQKNCGVYNDDFSAVFEDVESYVKRAKKDGYKKIILMGHSLGSNKIIHYLGNTKDDLIDYFIISSPIDLIHWWKVMPNTDECLDMAKKYIEDARSDTILPVLFGGFSPMCAKTVIDLYNADNLKNCPVISKLGETKSLKNIKPNGSFIIGSKDSVTGKSPKKFMETLNNWTKNPKNNQVIEIEGASHIFFNKHEIYAKTVLDCIKQHFLKGE